MKNDKIGNYIVKKNLFQVINIKLHKTSNVTSSIRRVYVYKKFKEYQTEKMVPRAGSLTMLTIKNVS